LAALIVIVILTFAAAGVLSYSLTTYRNSVRQTLLDKAKEVADSEMEYLFFSWKTDLLNKDPVANLSCVNPTTLVANPNSPLVQAGICGTSMTETETAFSSSESGWAISRTLVYNPISGTSDGSAQGIEPGTQQIGRNYYFSAETSATLNSPIVGTVTFHSGRHFVFSSTSLFQFAVFYQGNLEIAAGGNMTTSRTTTAPRTRSRARRTASRAPGPSRTRSTTRTRSPRRRRTRRPSARSRSSSWRPSRAS
jgi:hypothetical protein